MTPNNREFISYMMYHWFSNQKINYELFPHCMMSEKATVKTTCQFGSLSLTGNVQHAGPRDFYKSNRHCRQNVKFTDVSVYLDEALVLHYDKFTTTIISNKCR